MLIHFACTKYVSCYTYVSMYVYVCTYTVYTCLLIYLFTYLFTYLLVYSTVYSSIFMYTFTFIFVLFCTYVDLHIHMIHAQIAARAQKFPPAEAVTGNSQTTARPASLGCLRQLNSYCFRQELIGNPHPNIKKIESWQTAICLHGQPPILNLQYQCALSLSLSSIPRSVSVFYKAH